MPFSWYTLPPHQIIRAAVCLGLILALFLASACEDDITGTKGPTDFPPICFDYSTGASTPIIAEVETNYPDYVDAVNGCARLGDVLYVATACKLTAVDISRPDAPKIIASHTMPDLPDTLHSRCAVSAHGPPSSNRRLVCVLDREDGFWIFDASDEYLTTRIGFTPTSIPSYDIAQIDNLVFVATQSNGVEVFDVSLPDTPQLVDALEPSRAVFDLEICGSLLYLACGYEGIVVYDVSSGYPVVCGQTRHPTFLLASTEAAIYGVCAPAWPGGTPALTRFATEDASSPCRLVPQSATPLAAIPRSLAASDVAVYAACGSVGLEVFVDDSIQGVSCLGTCTLTRPVTAVTVVDGYLYVGSWKGIQVLPMQCADSVGDGPGPR
jgi:hypothetical protein